MKTAADTNPFVDVLAGTPVDAEAARRALILSAAAGTLSISAVSYAELARRFPNQSELDIFLEEFSCDVRDTDRRTAFLASRPFDEYRLRGGDKVRILADFLIAADALLHADRLLTRDKRFFGDGFPALNAVAPADL
jgi:hypothetical protein